jgi:hypothetical protein
MAFESRNNERGLESHRKGDSVCIVVGRIRRKRGEEIITRQHAGVEEREDTRRVAGGTSAQGSCSVQGPKLQSRRHSLTLLALHSRDIHFVPWAISSPLRLHQDSVFVLCMTRTLE